MNDLVKSVHTTGGIGVVGVFSPEIPARQTNWRRKKNCIRFRQLFRKRPAHGNRSMQRQSLQSLSHAFDSQRWPSRPWIISHELGDEGPEAYKHFDARDKGWTKVILHPAMRQRGASHQAEEAKAPRSKRQMAPRG